MQFTIRIIPLVFLISLILPMRCYAHVPHFEDSDSSITNPIEIKHSPEKSIAIYSVFNNDSDVDVVTFNISEIPLSGITLHLSSLVPGCKALQAILPTLLLVGPHQAGLPLTKSPHKQIVLESDQSGILIENLQQGHVWYEPYSRKSYYQQKALDLKITQTGTYTVYIWESNGLVGDYVLEIGDKEMWSFWDVIRTIGVMPKLWLDWEIHNKDCRSEL